MEARSMRDALKFENDVMLTFSSCLQDEKMELIPFGQIGDFSLPQGCKSLDITTPTIVEIKTLLRIDTLKRLLYYYDLLASGKESKNAPKLLVVYYRSILTPEEFNWISKTKNVSILSFEEIEKKTKKKQANDTAIIHDYIKSDQIELAKDAFSANNVSLFLGAGLSMAARLPSWNQLLESLLKKDDNKPFEYINEANTFAISESLSYSNIVTGRYVIEGYRESIKREKQKEGSLSEDQINDITNSIVTERMRKALYSKKSHNSPLINAVASIFSLRNVQQIITYNYDDLIESKIKTKSKYEIVYDGTITPKLNKKKIYHVHGFIPRDGNNPGIPVLSEKEYHQLYSHMHHWANVVQLNALYTTTCFFIGFSMSDPNQRRLLDLARSKSVEDRNVEKAPHFVFLKKEILKGEGNRDINEEHYREIEKIMIDLGLNVIWFNEFDQLPQILLYISGKNVNKPQVN